MHESDAARRMPTSDGPLAALCMAECPAPGRRVRRLAIAALAALGVVAMAGRAEAQLPPAESQFCDYLIGELKYFDTALRYIASLKRTYGDPDAQADLAYFEVEIVRQQGDREAYLEKFDAFTKRYPRHSRASLGDLPRINVEMGKVVELFGQAKESGDAARTAELIGQARAKFSKEVEGPIDQLIDSINKRVDGLEQTFRDERKKNPRAPESSELVDVRRNRNFAELARVKIFLIYARLLPADVEALAAERKKILEAGLSHATLFVEDRPEFYVMRYNAQLQKGLYSLELGRLRDAIDDLLIMVDIRPPVTAPPSGFPRELVDIFKDLNIQALLFATKALVRDRAYDDAVKLVDEKLLRPTGDAFDLRSAESSPALQKYFVLIQLERAVALAGRGDSGASLQAIEAVIKKYTAEASRNPLARAYVTDARKALGTIVEIGGVTLNGRAYYEGGLGLYSELLVDQALTLFQLGLASISAAKELAEVAPLCLDKIGEINYRKENFAEATLAYVELCERFPESPLAPKAAQNALASASKLLRGGRDHAGYRRLESAANAAFARHGAGGLGPIQVAFVEAQDLETQGKYREAREKYAAIPAQVDGEKVPFYHRAVASGLNCAFHVWLANNAEGRKEKEEEIRKVAAELEKASASASAAGQVDGAVMADFVRGQIFYELKDWPQVAAALSPFVAQHSQDRTYRAPALYFLVEAAIETDSVDAAAAAFAALRKDFAAEPSTQYAALLLTDFFSGRGDPESLAKAAEHILAYAEHPQSAAELRDAGRLMDIVDILIDGGLLAEAERYLAMAEKLDAGSTDLVNRIAVRRARFAFQKEDYATVIDNLRKFLDTYDFGAPAGPDDPAIFHMYAEALIRYRKTPQVADMQKAEHAYGYAVQLLLVRRGLPGPNQKKIEREFWEWYLHWMKVKKWLADAGDFNALKDLVIKLKAVERMERGDLGADFDTLTRWAEEQAAKKTP